MGDESAFDLRRAEAMPGDIDHIVDASRDPVVAVRVAPRAVAGEIFAGIGGEIGLHETLVIAVDRSHLSRPGVGDDEQPFARALQHIAGLVDDLGHDAQERPRRGTGLQIDRARQRRDENAARLGLPPCVDDGAAAVADDAVIPFPGFGIDRFAHGAEKAQRLAARLFYGRLARRHQRADRRRRGIEDVDAMLVDDLPEARLRRIIRHALEHQRRRAIGERAIDDIAVARDPADIRRAPVNVALAIVEDEFMGERGVDEIAAGRVQHALGLSGRTRGVENEERVFRAHLGVGAVGGDACGLVLVPEVAAPRHVDIRARARDDNDGLDGNLLQRRVDIAFQRNALAAAQAFIRGDDDCGLRVLDAAGERVRREPAEDHRMNGADARAGQHREGGLGNHRQIDGDAIVLPHAMLLEHIGEAADLLVQLGVSDVARLRRIVALPDDRGLIGAFGQMPVDAIHRDICRAVLEPADRDIVRVEARMLHFRERLDPVDALRLLAPESFRVCEGALVKHAIFFVVDPRGGLPLVGDGVDFFGHAMLTPSPPSPAPHCAASAAP